MLCGVRDHRAIIRRGLVATCSRSLRKDVEQPHCLHMRPSQRRRTRVASMWSQWGGWRVHISFPRYWTSSPAKQVVEGTRWMFVAPVARARCLCVDLRSRSTKLARFVAWLCFFLCWFETDERNFFPASAVHEREGAEGRANRENRRVQCAREGIGFQLSCCLYTCCQQVVLRV